MHENDNYEYICMVNKYLFSQMEECTVMINFLKENELDTSEFRAKRARLKTASNVNLDRLEVILQTMKS